MNTTAQMKIETEACETIVETARIMAMRFRGEIYRLQEQNRELIRDYAKLNDEYNTSLDEREALIQSACNKYHSLCPDFETLDTSSWCDLWHNICEPVELQVRAEMMKRGCKLELFHGIE